MIYWYLKTNSLGRVSRLVRWEEVKSIGGYQPGVVTTVQVVGRPARGMYRMRHHRGRSLKFTEIVGRERLAPLAYQPHAAAVAPQAP